MADWIVRMRREVITAVFCSDCTKEQALEDPWEYAESEEEKDQVDWEVLNVEENN